MREPDDLDWGRTARESKARNILIERAIAELASNLATRKFPGTHKDDHS